MADTGDRNEGGQGWRAVDRDAPAPAEGAGAPVIELDHDVIDLRTSVQPPAAASATGDSIRTAVALGWQLYELCDLVDVQEGADAEARLSGLPTPRYAAGFPRPSYQEVVALRLAQLWVGMCRLRPLYTSAGLEPPDPKHFAIEAPPDPESPPAPPDSGHVRLFSKRLLEVLTAVEFRVAKGYELGWAMADLCLRPIADEKDLTDRLTGARLGNVRGLLQESRSLLPAHAGQSVTGALDNWSIAWKESSGGAAPANRNEAFATGLQQRGLVWRSLLTGEKTAADLLTRDDYVKVGEGMLVRYRNLGTRFLAQWWPYLLGALVIVAGIAALFIKFGNGRTQGIGSLITILAGLGVTGKTAMATLSKTAAKAENSLWDAELDGAMAVAAAGVLPGGAKPVEVSVTRPLQGKQRKLRNTERAERPTRYR